MRLPLLPLLSPIVLAAGLAAGASAAATLTVRVTDQSAAAVQDAVVYLVANAPQDARPPVAVEVEQARLAFTPLVSAVQTGGTVSFPNRDTVRHHVYSFSPAKVFELRLYSGLPAKPVVFDKPGLVVLGCNIHDRMVAYVLVVDTPWYGKTGADGQVRMEGLPAGDYKLSVWQYRSVSQAAPKTIVVTSDTRLEAVVDLRPAS